MSIQALQQFMFRQSIAAGSLTALAAILEAKSTGTPLDPTLAEAAEALIAVVGATQLVADVSPQEAAQVSAMIRTFYMLDSKIMFAHARSRTWNHPEPDILNSIGQVARIHAHSFTRAVVPACEGLADRLSAPTASLLDVGVGVAGTAIALAQMWPELEIVGLEVWQPSLRLAYENVENAGLTDRIEIREQGVEALDDTAKYDAIYFALHFIPEKFARPGLQRSLKALRPGGWLVTAATPFEAMPPDVAALSRLRESQWGGPMWSVDETEQVLRDDGYVEIKRLPPQPGPPVIWIAGRRPG